MMSIDEAIAHAREVAKRNREQWKNCSADRRDIEHQTCEQCAEEYEQLAKWLEDYKHIKQWKSDVMDEFCKYDCNSVEEVRRKAIDDFLEKVLDKGIVGLLQYNEMLKISKKLKAGGNNA